MPDAFDVAERMKQRLLHECKSLAASRERIKADIEAYYRVKDELESMERRERRIKRILGVFGPESLRELYEHDERLPKALGAAFDYSPEELRDNLSVWEGIREYLEHVPEARIAEMESFFQAANMPNANRQAMESALKRHPETFKTRKDGREKYISLRKRIEKGE
jgi:hypothetical protein